jgi:hypothetical protein
MRFHSRQNPGSQDIGISLEFGNELGKLLLSEGIEEFERFHRRILEIRALRS